MTRVGVPLVNIPKGSNLFRLGDVARPVLKDFEWIVHENQCWAVVGPRKSLLLQALAGHLRISPPPPPPAGLFPFLSVSRPPRDPHTHISLLSFSPRPLAQRGAFYDYTSRYGAIRDEDRVTLRQSMNYEEDETVVRLAKQMGLDHLLDLPLVALSNGQTRRARILRAILTKPEILLLDDPLTGLDASQRPVLLALLHSLHTTRSPRVILGLRVQDSIPDWITHVAVVGDDRVVTGRKDISPSLPSTTGSFQSNRDRGPSPAQECKGNILVQMENVRVQYDHRMVLQDINWEIREGDRWHLQGSNGSGKTTLLALLTGDHPQSYTQLPPHSKLSLFSLPRTKIPTMHLRTRIGAVSPELTAAFPRRSGMSVWEAIGTGFDGGFVSLGRARVGIELAQDEERKRVGRVWDLLKRLEKHVSVAADGHANPSPSLKAFANRSFASLSAGEQAIVLLMRALVGRPPLLLLDEPWSGMDEGMVKTAHIMLREEVEAGCKEQAVVVVCHWEEEVPWTIEEGLKIFKLGR